MDEAKVKRYAAIIEIFILLSFAIYYVNKLIISNHIYEESENFYKNRQNPSKIVTAGLYGKSSNEVINGIMGQKTEGIFKKFLGFLNPIFGVFGRIFKIFQDQINGIRQMLRPIRDFFNATAQKFYALIQKFTIGIMYSMHKMRNSMRRSMSGFNILMHSLEHSKNSMQSMITSPPVRLSVKWLSRAQWVKKKAGRLFCFDKDTYIKLHDGNYVKIYNIKVGDIIEDGSEVISTHKFSNTNTIYKYDSIYVSGNHLVKEDDTWVFVNKSKRGTPVFVKPQYLYCLSTTSGEIKIGNILFKDYEGSINKYVNKTINSLILMKLNSTETNTITNSGFNEDVDESDYAAELKYLENGFYPDTEIEMKGGYYKPIKDIKIGDTLSFYNKVIGIVKISNKFVHYYKDKNGIIVTSNTKVFDEGIWKNIEKIPDIEPQKNIDYTDAINLVTENSTLRINCGKKSKHYRDYLEFIDTELDTEIENLTLKNANM
tara:strand:- start:8863 stop:10320 length:1458 start_codon:yes stop_codon:yes gene_type:complete